MVTRLIGGYQKVWMLAVKDRLDATINMLRSIKAVKMLGYEESLSEVIQGLRILEVDRAMKYRNVSVYSWILSK